MAKLVGSLTGSEMRRARESLGLTTTEVAARIGVSERTVSRWESGHRIPETAAKLFRILYDVETEAR